MDLRTAYERDGFAIARQVIPVEEVKKIADQFDRLEAIARTLPATGDVGSARFVIDPSPFRIHRIVWCGGASSELEVYGGDPRFLTLAHQILGDGPLVQLVQQAHFKLPGDGVAFAWHQDASNRRYGTDLWNDLDGRGSYVQMVLAIDPMGAKNGGLRVIPGSHRRGFIADPDTGLLPSGILDEKTALDPLLDPGDVLIFGPFLIHGSSPNLSEGPRRILIQGYTLPGVNRRVYPGCGVGIVRE
jgi:hypothetical protein